MSCVSVDVPGGACGSTTPPGVVTSDFTVTGYLKEAFTICDYIDSAGWDNLTNEHLVALYYKFLGYDTEAEKMRLKIPEAKRPTTFPRLLTNDYLVGIYYYFIGYKESGNNKTGCNY